MIALGARAVMIGRAWAWSVAARGQVGVSHMLEVMKADIDVALGLTGSNSFADLDRGSLHQPEIALA
jgi:L-lactate dehydrogenase (cytochrome)